MSVTNWRKVINPTGLDLTVPPDAQTDVKTEHTFVVVVVTTLASYKNPRKHAAQDVIQFAVSRTHKQFQSLCDALLTESPNLGLPEPPRRSTRVALSDRAEAMNRIVMFIAQHESLCTADPVLRFLGIDLARARAAKKAFAEKAKQSSLFAEEETDNSGEEEEGERGGKGAKQDTDDLFGASEINADELLLFGADVAALEAQEGGKLLGDDGGGEEEGKEEEEEIKSGSNNTDGGGGQGGGRSTGASKTNNSSLFDDTSLTEGDPDALLSEEMRTLLHVGEDSELEALLTVGSNKKAAAAAATAVGERSGAASSASTAAAATAPDPLDALFGSSTSGAADNMGASDIADYLAAATVAGADQPIELDLGL